MDAVVSVFPYRTEVWETLLAGHAPGAMAITESDRAARLSAGGESRCRSRHRARCGNRQTRRAGAGGPRARGQIVITPDNQYALVLNEKSGDMAVIRIFSLGGNQVGGDRVKRYKSAPLFTMIPVGERPVSGAVVVFSGLVLLLRRGRRVLHSRQAELAAQVGQRFERNVAHDVGHGEAARFGGQDRDAGDLARFGAHADLDVFAVLAGLHADDPPPLGRLQLAPHLVQVGRCPGSPSFVNSKLLM